MENCKADSIADNFFYEKLLEIEYVIIMQETSNSYTIFFRNVKENLVTYLNAH